MITPTAKEIQKATEYMQIAKQRCSSQLSSANNYGAGINYQIIAQCLEFKGETKEATNYYKMAIDCLVNSIQEEVYFRVDNYQKANNFYLRIGFIMLVKLHDLHGASMYLRKSYEIFNENIDEASEPLTQSKNLFGAAWAFFGLGEYHKAFQYSKSGREISPTLVKPYKDKGAPIEAMSRALVDNDIDAMNDSLAYLIEYISTEEHKGWLRPYSEQTSYIYYLLDYTKRLVELKKDN